MQDDYQFDPAGKYKLPAANADIDDTKVFIDKTVPKDDNSEVFGLHDNVNITSAIKESQSIFDTMLSLQPRSATGVCFLIVS